MNGEAFFNIVDQLILEAREDHRGYLSRLCACDGEEELLDELELEMARFRSDGKINWARVFIIAVIGEKHDLD